MSVLSIFDKQARLREAMAEETKKISFLSKQEKDWINKNRAAMLDVLQSAGLFFIKETIVSVIEANKNEFPNMLEVDRLRILQGSTLALQAVINKLKEYEKYIRISESETDERRD